MILTIIEYIASLAESMIAADFIIKYNDVKFKSSLLTFLFITFALFSSIVFFNFLADFEGLYGLIYIAVLGICSIIFLNGRIIEKLFSSVLCIVLVAVIDITILTLFSSMLDISISELITKRNVFRLIILFFTKFLYFLASRFILVMTRKSKNHLNMLEWIMITLIFVTTLSISLLSINFVYKFNLSSSDYYLLHAVVIGIVIINLVSFYLFTVLNKHHKDILQLTGMKIQMEQQNKSLDDLKALSLEMRKIQHDTAKYINITSTLISEGKHQKALEYLGEIQKNKLDDNFHVIVTSNDVINAVLNIKYTYCRKNNIEFIYQITTDLSVLSDVELSILLANLLDNAIEGAIGSKNPFVKISISEAKAYLVIIITNSIPSSIIKNNPGLITTKKDKEHHGLGLLTIRDVVEKYDGILNFSEENLCFSADVRLKLPNINQ